ncbi:hypothetical protein [Hymenobacter terrestris]|uniref:Uncharacterized protein n=1 Tax=Hymenobacter terrestris TaxID=2748310 RepID=A0ABX2Q2P9_9BACT|nr:hypothetical protein [Hymenobacter terrestris]NVO84701.1 hypothetical protein [Hymenobacter terrestris]
MTIAFFFDVHGNLLALEAVLAGANGVRSELVRVAYDVERAAQAVAVSPLPNEYAFMLCKAY